MKSLIQLLDALHAPLIVIGVYLAGVFCLLGLGMLFWIIAFAICDFLHDVVGLGRSDAMFWTMLGVPMFAGFLGFVWWGVRQVWITDRVVDYLETGNETRKNGNNKLKSTGVKGVLSEAVMIRASTVMNKIRKNL
jgi:hypothetical protein